MAKRKIVALYPVPASHYPTSSTTTKVFHPCVYCVDDHGDAWITAVLPGHPQAFQDWEQLPDLPDSLE